MNKYRTDKNGLNRKEREVLKYVEKEIIRKGYAPSVREICKAVNLSSTATVQGYLVKLEEKGFISKEKEKGRTIRLIKNSRGENVVSQMNGIRPTKKCYTSKEIVNVPVIGQLTLGQAVLCVENIVDTFPLAEDFVGTKDAFILTVKGDSMIKAGILDGDNIVVKRQGTCQDGDIVVAIIEDEITVRTFYKEEDKIKLQAENSTIEPIVVEDCKILGKVTGVFRRM